jgi:hypothetical protein
MRAQTGMDTKPNVTNMRRILAPNKKASQGGFLVQRKIRWRGNWMRR